MTTKTTPIVVFLLLLGFVVANKLMSCGLDPSAGGPPAARRPGEEEEGEAGPRGTTICQ